MIPLLCRLSETQNGKQLQNPFAVRTLLFRSGERFPILVDSETNEPDFDTTIYVTTHLRATGKASNTIKLHLRAILVLKLYLKFREIDLSERIRTCEMLRPHELDELVKWCGRPLSSIVAYLRSTKSCVYFVPQSKSKHRGHTEAEICSQSGTNKIHEIRNFLDWFVRDRVTRLSTQERTNSINAWQMCRASLEARSPRKRRRNQVGRREGAHPDVVAKLISVVEPSSQQNPWKSEHARARNQLIVHWLYSMGIRRGELLNIKISDINFRRETVLIVRRADDKNDPRMAQPLVKTRDRDIPVGAALVSLTIEYITKYRSKFSGARLHDYLFVSQSDGAPLSLSMVNEIFENIRCSVPGSFESLSPHVLRHTWNDNFSERCDELNLPPGDEASMRSYIMGWSPTSDSATTYTRRHIRKKAQQVSLAMQADSFERGKDDA